MPKKHLYFMDKIFVCSWMLIRSGEYSTVLHLLDCWSLDQATADSSLQTMIVAVSLHQKHYW